jgi:serine/threonine protein kinase
MLVGKLPFRSPRQGTKRRQKLLEQISSGLTESHERELEHVSRTARDLIFRLLQPDSQRRIKLDEVMVHPWITKEGTQALHPFKCTPPDAKTQLSVSWPYSSLQGNVYELDMVHNQCKLVLADIASCTILGVRLMHMFPGKGDRTGLIE